ncbi:A24 family peptidase [Roseovarius nitratireducens]|uniref:A24 family peptidase n=1 Tax=Roseovarius nitratireducens TaxID=2044597 RepID=UPI000CE21579|nr:prepilin peptidase [Roseovarius nitratireducens]
MIFLSLWFVAGQLCAAVSDAVTLRIPNALILYLLAGYAATAALTGPGWADLAASAAVGIAILAGGALLFARGWMGGGDVKLLAVTALWLEPAAMPAFLLLTAMAGGLLTLALVICRALGAHRLAGDRFAALRAPMDRVPYGIAIAAAAIAVAFLRPGALLTG